MVQYGMVIDLHKCVGCHSCSVACKSEWRVPDDFGRSWVKRLGPENTPHGISYTFYPGLCNHCDTPSCVEACPTKKVAKKFEDQDRQQAMFADVAAIWKDPLTGIVQIDKRRCSGCGACADACPYEAIYINRELGGSGVADKCDFCVERLALGLEPACIIACPVDARVFGDLNDPDSDVRQVKQQGAEGLRSSQIDIGPNVYYLASKKDMYMLKKTSSPQVR